MAYAVNHKQCHSMLASELTPITPPSVIADWFVTERSPMIGPECSAWANVTEGFKLGTARALETVPLYPDPELARGITIVGGGKYLASAYITVRVLRHVGCTLPIDIWHFESENDPCIEAAIREYNVTFWNATKVCEKFPFRFMKGHWWSGWQLKSFALLCSRFESTLLLDADSYPTRDPEYLFDWPGFANEGAVIWPDQEISPTILNSATCNLFEIEIPDGPTAESGQLLVNRRKCWQQLVLAGYYNQAADLVYRYIWGDKDTFPIAFFRTKKSFSRMWPSCQIVPDCILQFDFSGRVIFQHRCCDKFKLATSEFDSTPQQGRENRYNPCLAHEGFCFSALEDLRSIIAAQD